MNMDMKNKLNELEQAYWRALRCNYEYKKSVQESREYLQYILTKFPDNINLIKCASNNLLNDITELEESDKRVLQRDNDLQEFIRTN